MNRSVDQALSETLDRLASATGQALEQAPDEPIQRELGVVSEVGRGVATVVGLPGAQSEELLRMPGGQLGMAFNLDPDRIGVILLDSGAEIEAGDQVQRTGRTMDVPVGQGLLGRMLDPAGRARDGKGRISAERRLPIERPAPGVLERSPVQTPLQTGVKVVDAVVPIGRGQRELIVGDRQTGKTQIAIDAIVHQRDADVICIYCAIGQRNSATAKVVEGLRGRGALDYTVVVVAGGEDPAGLRFVAPYAAMSIGEHFMEQGRDVLVVFDDLTHHARSYRELSLLLRRPPGREAYPGDIFYIHSRLLERSTHLSDERGGGSLTALPIIETEAQNISAYIPTNLISITDGQIYVSPTLFQQGQLPAVDVGRSVSRVGGKAQLKAFREAAGDLRLAYSQFQELEKFSRYGTRLQESQRKQLEHGRRVRYILRQDQYSPIPAGLQVVVLLATNWGYLDEVPLERIGQAEQAISEQVKDKASDVLDRIESGQELRDEDRDKLRGLFEDALSGMSDGSAEGEQDASTDRQQADAEAADETRADSGAQDTQAEQDSRPDQED